MAMHSSRAVSFSVCQIRPLVPNAPENIVLYISMGLLFVTISVITLHRRSAATIAAARIRIRL